MDKNEFFREITSRICGNFDLGEGLFLCLQVIKRVIPAEFMFMEVYDDSYHAIRTIALADLEKGEMVDFLVPTSSEALEEYEKVKGMYTKDIYISPSTKDDKLSKEILEFHGIESASVMVLPLRYENKPIGAAGVLVKEDNIYTKEHAEWLDILREPLSIAMSNNIKHREVVKLKDLLAEDNRYLNRELMQIRGDEIVGSNFGLKNVMEKVRQVAILDSPILLLGETGVGKDVIANAIHYSSTRQNDPFVKVNCGAIAESLIDSELFGHEKGAFTGALKQKRGLFERANSGTIFLDEIGEFSLNSQVRLLHVLQDKVIERVGGSKKIQLDIRIIAATNRNLEEMVKQNKFREDLWFRLNVFPIDIPPLRKRQYDIPALLQYFITKKSKELKLPDIPKIASGVAEPLMHYDWPGNVRELQNVVERALILNPEGPITFDHLNLQSAKTGMTPSPGNKAFENLDAINTKHIYKALELANGKIHGPGGAAELLGINGNTLRNKMNRLGINYLKANKD